MTSKCAVVDGEAHVGHADLEEVGAALPGGGEGVGQQLVALRGDGGEQPGFVAEVVCRRGVRDPGTAGQVTQAQLGGARLAEDSDRGSQDGLAQVAVVVGPGRGHAPTVAAI